MKDLQRAPSVIPSLLYTIFWSVLALGISFILLTAWFRERNEYYFAQQHIRTMNCDSRDASDKKGMEFCAEQMQKCNSWPIMNVIPGLIKMVIHWCALSPETKMFIILHLQGWQNVIQTALYPILLCVFVFVWNGARGAKKVKFIRSEQKKQLKLKSKEELQPQEQQIVT